MLDQYMLYTKLKNPVEYPKMGKKSRLLGCVTRIVTFDKSSEAEYRFSCDWFKTSWDKIAWTVL